MKKSTMFLLFVILFALYFLLDIPKLLPDWRSYLILILVLELVIILLRYVNAKLRQRAAQIAQEQQQRFEQEEQKRKDEAARQAAENEERKKRQAENERRIAMARVCLEAQKAGRIVPDAIKGTQPDEPTAPMDVNGKTCAYRYHDVTLIPDEKIAVEPLLSRLISFQPQGEEVAVLCKGVRVGAMKSGTLQRMVREWTENHDPIWAMITHADEEAHTASFELIFYRDELGYQLRKTPNAQKYRLTGNRNEEAQGNIAYCEEGKPCTVDFDWDKEKYAVCCDGLEIGCLPASAARIAEECGAENVKVFIADLKIDDEGKTVVFVYVFD